MCKLSHYLRGRTNVSEKLSSSTLTMFVFVLCVEGFIQHLRVYDHAIKARIGLPAD